MSATNPDRRRYPSDVAFTGAVKALQRAKGSRHGYASMERAGGWETSITPELVEFVEQLDMCYLATANAEGQPYVQYRGGPPGFLKTLDERTIAFANFGGNRQFITLGNLSENPKAFLFLMDYANRRRVKLWGTAPVAAWDMNCPQHIHPRFSQRHITQVAEQLRQRVAELEAEVARLRSSPSSNP